MSALPNGIQLGPFQIIETIGQGGFGITYHAVDSALRTHVVIKEHLPTSCAYRAQNGWILPRPGANKEYTETLTHARNEMRILQNLRHPNIVRVLQDFEALGTFYYVMPWLNAKNLGESCPPPEQMNESWLIPILRSLLNALGYLHSNKICHRDIKPSNILLLDNKTPIIIDFGAAKILVSSQSGFLIEAPGFTPVEQLQNNGAVGPWSDLYALGASCYKLMTGSAPPRSIDRMAGTAPYIPLKDYPGLTSRYSEGFINTVEKALQLDHRLRWQSANQWAQALPTMEQIPPPPDSTIPFSMAPVPSGAGIPHKLMSTSLAISLCLTCFFIGILIGAVCMCLYVVIF